MFANLTDLPCIHNFKEAVNLYNRTKGIRGRSHIRPLKTTRRNPDAYQITAKVDGGGNIRAVHCWLYRTPVLTYTPDSLIIQCFNSQTTNKFINNIAPAGICAYTQNGEQRIAVRGEGVFVGDKVVIPMDEKWQVKPGEVQADKLEEIVLNRTRAAEARKGCKDVIELARVTSKMDGYWQGLVDSTEVSGDDTLMRLKHLLKWMGYRAFQTWRGATMHKFNGISGYAVGSTEELIPRLKKHIYETEYTEQQCYDYIPAPYGVIPKNYRSV